jgi:MinD-like ATPase involved in chromosome partitioning or flagellar assembly
MVIIAGHFGSGKTEFAINLSTRMAEESKIDVNLIDLDFVNPYFRSRRFREELKDRGVNVEEPVSKEVSVADIPSISASVMSKLYDGGSNTVIEVGGDHIGARILGSLTRPIEAANYEMWLVFNRYRPDTDTPDKVKMMVESIEKASKLKVSSLISNCHLKELTDSSTLIEGLHFTKELADGYLPVKYFCVEKSLPVPEEVTNSGYELFRITRYNTYCYEEGKFSRIQI